MASIVVDIIRNAIQNFPWNNCTANNEYLMKQLEKEALKYEMTLEQLREKSLQDAKELINYSYIPFVKNNDNCIPYYGTNFIIWIDEENRVWVLFRCKVLKHQIDYDTMEVISHLGSVYMHIGKNVNCNFNIISDNVVQLDIQSKIYPKIERFSKYLRGYYDNCYSNDLIVPFQNMGEYVEYIETCSTIINYIPNNVKTLKIMNNYLNLMGGNGNCAIIIPYGVINIYFNNNIMDMPFSLLPPTIEHIYVENLYTQLNGFPYNLKSLTINKIINPMECIKNPNPIKITHNCKLINEVLCYDCNDNTMLKVYKYYFEHVEFPNYFEKLILVPNVDNFSTIIKAITKIPETFTQIVLLYKYKTVFNNEIYKLYCEFIKKFPNINFVCKYS